MNYVKNYECTICGEIYEPSNELMTCPKCHEKGILEINYDYEAMRLNVNFEYFKHNTDYSMMRYKPLMSINSHPLNTLKVGWTPLYESKHIKSILGLTKLYLKDEGVNPTASLKDRASLVACIKAIEENYDTICCSSTGNAASSLAGNAAKLGLKSVIFVPKRAPIGKLSQLVVYGANVIQIDGDYKDTFKASKEVINKYKFYNRNAAINPHLVEGKKTVALEIAEQLKFGDLDYVFVSVGDGCTVASVYKGYFDLFSLKLINRIPKIIGVQAEGCKPFVDAFINRTEVGESAEDTIADSIAVGIPRNPVKGLRAITKSNGFYMSVTDEEIISAIELLGKKEGIFAEPAGAAALAGLVKAVNSELIDKQSKVAVIITGNGLKDVKSIESKVEEVSKISSIDLINKMNEDLKYNTNANDLFEMIKTNEVKEYE
jgi:threonine synthase